MKYCAVTTLLNMTKMKEIKYKAKNKFFQNLKETSTIKSSEGKNAIVDLSFEMSKYDK